jgi:hypothetical protein
MSNLILTPEHDYFLDNVEIPGVSKILEAAGLSTFDDVKAISTAIAERVERSSAFGKAVHSTIQFKCKGTLDESTVDDAIKPCVQGWDNFVEDYGYTCRMTEYRGYSAKYRFAFTIDQLGDMAKGKNPGPTLADIKTGKPTAAHKYQMGGYKIGAGDEYKNIVIVYLDPSFPRGYKVEFATNNKREQAVFLSALTLYNVRKQEKLL